MAIKKILILSTLLFSIISYCQEPFRFGIKAGGNVSGLWTKNSANSGGTGFHLGGVAEYPISTKLAFAAELLYSQKGGTYRVATMPYTVVDADLSYISMPILAKINIVKNFKFEVGPEINFLIGDKFSQDGVTVGEFTDPKTFDMAVAGGLSYEFNNRMFIQGRYSYGLTKIFDDRDYATTCITLSLGYFFK
jgi:opacity protein-like surface antigen